MNDINLQSAGFVRDDISSKIYKQLAKGESIKLIGIPGIGISTLMRYIYQQCQNEHGRGANFCAFFVDNRYDRESLVYNVNKQLKDFKMNAFALTKQGPLLKELCQFVCFEVEKKFPQKKTLFIFDNFQENFKKHKLNETILDDSTLTDMKMLSDKGDKIQFLVNYTYPIDAELHDDWYLNNLYTIEVGLLSHEEVLELIEIRMFQQKTEQIDNKDEIIGKIKFYGGRHPSILDKLSSCDFSDFDETLFVKYSTHFFLQIQNSLKKEEKKLMLPEGYFLEKFQQIVRGQYDEKSRFNEFTKSYCYEDIIEGRKNLKLFSQYFESWVMEALEPENIKNLIKDYRAKYRAFQIIEKTRVVMEKKILFQRSIVHFCTILVLFIYAITLLYVFNRFDFGRHIEPVVTFISILIPVFSYIKIPFFKFNLRNYVKKINTNITNRMYDKYEYTPETYNSLKDEIENLRKQIGVSSIHVSKEGFEPS